MGEFRHFFLQHFWWLWVEWRKQSSLYQTQHFSNDQNSSRISHWNLHCYEWLQYASKWINKLYQLKTTQRTLRIKWRCWKRLHLKGKGIVLIFLIILISKKLWDLRREKSLFLMMLRKNWTFKKRARIHSFAIRNFFNFDLLGRANPVHSTKKRI